MALQGRTYQSTLRLLATAGGAPQLGVAFGDVVVKFAKAGALALDTKTLLVTDWVELGDGFYSVLWAEGEMDTLGEFRWLAAHSGSVDATGVFSVDPVPLTLLVPPTKCLVTGNIVDLAGQVIDTEITFRVVKLPATAGGAIVAGGILRTDPDISGNFSVVLLRGMTVMAEIPKAGLKYQFVVPDQETADLVDLLPPFP